MFRSVPNRANIQVNFLDALGLDQIIIFVAVAVLLEGKIHFGVGCDALTGDDIALQGLFIKIPPA